jgi:uncharacterized SAM-binding protein YcdF (DUF218 family)
MLKGEDIICVSSIDWDFNWQGHQEIMSTFAKNGNRVLFIENTGVRSPRLEDLPRLKKRIINWRKGLYGIRKEIENLYVYSPLILPYPYSNLAKRINRFILLRTIEKWMDTLDFNNPIIWTFLPNITTLDLIEQLNKKMVIYYCLDNFATLTDHLSKLAKIESLLVKKSDIVFTSSDTLTSKWKDLNSNCYTFSVGIPKFFLEETNIPLPPDDMKVPRPIIGYVGGIHKWVDLELVKSIAKDRPDWSVVLIGPHQCDISKLKSIPNIYLLGEKDHELLSRFVNFFDVCLIPYKPTDFSNVAYPTKLMIYFALGKPVVAYRTEELKQFRELIYLTDEALDFTKQIEVALNEDNVSLAKRRIQIAEDNVWDEKIERMSGLIKEAIEAKRLEKGMRWKENLLILYRKTRRRLVRVGAIALLGYLLLFKTPLIWLLAAPLKIAELPQKADAIIVFAGGVGESGEAGQGYEERVEHAVNLYKEGYAPYLIFSSGYVYRFREPEVMKILATSLSIPSNAIILEEKATNTYENVKFTKEILEENGWNSVLLISSPYHMCRASLVFRKIAKDIKVIHTPIPHSLFYSRKEGVRLRHIQGVMHEYLGIIYYWWKGWI